MDSTRYTKIVIVTEAILGQWYDGVSLLVRHFLEHLPPDVTCETWSLRPEKNSRIDGSRWNTRFLNRLPTSRADWLLRVAGIPVGEKRTVQANQELFDACQGADAIFLFTSADSVFSTAILSRWPQKTILHLTDSGSVFASRSGMWRHFIRQRLSEWKAAKAKPTAIVFVSAHDRDIFVRSTGSEASRVMAIPLGVDSDTFHPASPEDKPADRPFTLLFTGVLDYAPNTEAADYIVTSILPKLPEDVRVTIAGLNPPQALLDAAIADPRLYVTGPIPDIERVYREADLFIAPMFKGAGMQNKILQALSSGLPVLTTPICVLAFEKASDALVACSGTDEFLDAISELRANTPKRLRLSTCARDLILNYYSWERRCSNLLALIPGSSDQRFAHGTATIQA